MSLQLKLEMHLVTAIQVLNYNFIVVLFQKLHTMCNQMLYKIQWYLVGLPPMTMAQLLQAIQFTFSRKMDCSHKILMIVMELKLKLFQVHSVSYLFHL